MITLTQNAIKQVRIAHDQNSAAEMGLRLAAKKEEDGSISYGMGFDEVHEDDMIFKFDGIQVMFAPVYGPLLNGATLDFVELNPGEMNFIFLNPNDAHYAPEGSESSGGGCGGGSCSGGGCS